LLMNPNEIRIQKRKRRFEAGVLQSLKDDNDLKLVTHFLDAKDLLQLMQTKKEFRNTISGSFDKLCYHLDQEFIVNFDVYFVSQMPTNTMKLLRYFNMFCMIYGTEVPHEKNKNTEKQGFLSTLTTYFQRYILRRTDIQISKVPKWKRNEECTAVWLETEAGSHIWQIINGEMQIKIIKKHLGFNAFATIIIENNIFPNVIENCEKLKVLTSLRDVRFKDDSVWTVEFFINKKFVIPSKKRFELREEFGKVISFVTLTNFKRHIRKYDIGKYNNE